MTDSFRRGRHGIGDTQYARIGYWRVVKQERVPVHLVSYSRRLLYEFRNHTHPYAERLLSELIAKDVGGLQDLDTMTPELREEFFETRYLPHTTVSPRTEADLGGTPVAVLARMLDGDGNTPRSLLPVNDLDFDYAHGAYSVYNWELFFHVPYTIALQLSKNQRYAEAQRWLHYIFNPTDNSDGTTPQRFWRTKPFRIDEVEHVEKTLLNLSTGDDPDLRERTVAAVGQWRDRPFRPHLVARTRPSAYMYATVMAYLDNLVAWGDSLFRQDTRESINEAMQYYVLAANILGPKPQAVPKKGSLSKQTYASLRNDLDEFGNAVRALEADIPFDLVGKGQPVEGTPEDGPLESLGRSLYFCVPRNDKLLGYWDTVADRLFKIRNSLNLQGVFRQLPLFAPPIDPAMLARTIAAGVDVASIIAGTAAPLAPVRFQVLLQKALEICQEVKSLGGQILAALEKKDNEALGVLRARHESNLLGLVETVRYAQWQEALKNREGVGLGLQNAFQRFRHYDRLLGTDGNKAKLPEYTPLDTSTVDARRFSADEPTLEALEAAVEIAGGSLREGGHNLNPAEAQELTLLEAAQITQDVGTVLEGVGAVLNMVPEFGANATPFGVGATMQHGGTKLGHMFSGLAAVTRGVAARIQHEATLSGKMASYDRREQDWALQRKLAAGELNQLYKQLRGAELREYIAKREYENHRKQVAQAKDVEDFLTNEKRKTSTESFYLWMKREAQGLHAQCFQFAYDVAKKAERAFQHELGDGTAEFLKVGYLSGREGLFAGEKLYLDLKRMDVAYAELNTREFELTKHISLRDWFPLALMDLRSKGTCAISIPEALFDLDCPGHSFRRIKSVAVSLPCVTGPYASVNCNLTLQQSYVRTKATGEPWYPTDIAADSRFAAYSAATMSIVTSNAQSDTGTFEPNLRDERYLPFEGAGVISDWQITLLGQPRQFDFDTIADLILTIRYTARPGAPGASVSEKVEEWLGSNSARLFSIRHEFPSEWARFRASTEQKPILAFDFAEGHFPYRFKEALKGAKRLHLFARTKEVALTVALNRGTTSIGSSTLTDGYVVLPDPAGGSFDARGSFELTFDKNAVDDLWVVLDWAGS